LWGSSFGENDTAISPEIAVTAGDTTFTLPAAVTTLDVGDSINMTENDAYIGAGCRTTTLPDIGYCYGWSCEVTDITGSTVTCLKPSPVTISVDETRVYDNVPKNVTIDNLIYDATAMTESTSYDVGVGNSGFSSHGFTVKNSEFYGNRYASAAVSLYGDNHTIESNYCNTFFGEYLGNHNLGYCYAVNSTGSISIKNNFGMNAKHVITASGARPVTGEAIIADNNVIYNQDDWDSYMTGGTTNYYEGAIDAHANVNKVVYSNNYISSPESMLVRFRNTNLSLINNTIIQRAVAVDNTTFSNSGIIYGNESTPESLMLIGNTISSEETTPSLLEYQSGSFNLTSFTRMAENNIGQNIVIDKPQCGTGTEWNEGRTWYGTAATGTHEVCAKVGGVLQWVSLVLPSGTSKQMLIHNGTSFTAQTLGTGGDVEFGTGYNLDIQPDSVTNAMLDSDDTPVVGECVTIAASGKFNFDACSGAAQQASNVSVDTTAFAGNFANDTSHDSAQELFDLIDDFSLVGLAEADIDTLAELNAIVADATLPSISGTPDQYHLAYFNDSGTLTFDENLKTNADGGLELRDIGGGVGRGFTVYEYVNSVAANTANFRKARGTEATPLIVNSGDYTGIFYGAGYNGSAFETNVGFRFVVDGTPVASGTDTTSQVPQGIEFLTRANNTDAFNVPLTLGSNNTVKINDLSGTYSGGSAYVCVYDSGVIYASETACP
jgi:hypothetical protein